MKVRKLTPGELALIILGTLAFFGALFSGYLDWLL
jgi:hypothetical protein